MVSDEQMEFFMRAVEEQCKEIVSRTQSIVHLMKAVLAMRRRSPEFAFMTVDVDLVEARSVYLGLKAELLSSVGALYESPSDVNNHEPSPFSKASSIRA